MLKGFNLARRSLRAQFDSRDAKVLRAVVNSNPDLLCKLSINKGPEGHIIKLTIGKLKTNPKSSRVRAVSRLYGQCSSCL